MTDKNEQEARAIIDLDSIGVEFSGRRVLHDVTLSLRVGDIVALMGPSGSGKSTLLSVLGQLLIPTSGRVTTTLRRDADISWIFQSSPVMSRRRAIENVALGPLAKGVTRRQSDRIARDALREVGLDKVMNQRAFRLSGGERQRVVVARCMAADSKLILADEPTASLDAANRDQICRALVRAATQNRAVVIATHDPIVAAACQSVFELTP